MGNRQIDLFCVDIPAVGFDWAPGKVWCGDPAPRQFIRVFHEAVEQSQADAWLFWDPRLGQPPARQAARLLESPDDLWHAGLRLGTGGLPGLVDFVAPTGMLYCDPHPAISAASWRVSLRACLVRAEVIRELGFLDPGFETLDGAALEWGHRCITRGALCRNEPELVDMPETKTMSLPPADELRFVRLRLGRGWAFWAVQRALFTGYWDLPTSLQAWRCSASRAQPSERRVYRHGQKTAAQPVKAEGSVTVLIPTVDRYPYLRTLLEQLRQQTRPAAEIIIVDQSSAARRQSRMYDAFADLPIKVLYQERPGQCSARNAGLMAAQGDYILFVDDDDEVPTDLIEKHLLNLQRFDAQVSCGVANESGAGKLPEPFTFLRSSNVFPTNNSMIRRLALKETGLFDLAFDHGARADAELGLRLSLSGARMILEPEISVLHHHAPGGGLRLHNARAITYASSRRNVFHRHLPSVTEIYLALRYFSARQVHEMLVMRAFGTLSSHGTLMQRLAKAFAGLVILPATLWTIYRRKNAAIHMLQRFPQIPLLHAQSHEIDAVLPEGNMISGMESAVL